jgi:hypothetical protein
MTNEDMTIEQAVEQYHNVHEALKTILDERDRLLAVIYSYMDNEGMKRMETGKHTVTIPTKRQYDVAKFVAIMGEEIASEYVTPEHEETKVVKAKVDGTKAKKLWDMGNTMVAKLESTLIPQRPEIKVEVNKQERAM